MRIINPLSSSSSSSTTTTITRRNLSKLSITNQNNQISSNHQQPKRFPVIPNQPQPSIIKNQKELLRDPLLFPRSNNHNQNHHQKQPTNRFNHRHTNFPKNPPVKRPQLSSSIASIYNVALVYLHRGLDLHQTNKNINGNRNEQDKIESFRSSIVKGFNQILFLETGLEHSQSNQTLNQLIEIILNTPDRFQDSNWAEIRATLTYIVRFRVRVELIDRWCSDQLRKKNYGRLVEIWSEIVRSFEKKKDLSVIGLNPRFFTSLVLVSSITKKSGNDLSSTNEDLYELVKSLTDRIASSIEFEEEDLINLDHEDQIRARYYLRAVRLGLEWRQPLRSDPSTSTAKDNHQEEGGGDDLTHSDQDQRIIHLIRRNLNSKQPESIGETLKILENIEAGVLGHNRNINDGHQEKKGWLKVNWLEPDPKVRERNLSDSIEKREIVLTQRVIGTMMNGFSELGMVETVERLIKLSKTLGGMSRYLWMNIFRGLVNSNNNSAEDGKRKNKSLDNYELIESFVDRMREEDGFEVDLNIRCILISGMISKDFEKGLGMIDQLIFSLKKSNPTEIDHSEGRTRDDGDGAVEIPIENFNMIISTLLRHQLIDKARDLIKHCCLSSTEEDQPFSSSSSSKTTSTTTTSSSLIRVKPDSTTLNHFLKFYSTQNPQSLNFSEVLKTLKTFENSLNVRPNVISFTILFNILIRFKEFLSEPQKLIKKILNLMKLYNVEANAITYGSIINMLCKSGDYNDVFLGLEVLNEIESLGVATTSITYTALIQALLRNHINEFNENNGSNGRSSSSSSDPNASSSSKTTTTTTTRSLELAIGLIDRLKSRNLSINQVIYNSLINALLVTGQVEKGLKILEILKNDYLRGVKFFVGRRDEDGRGFGDDIYDGYGTDDCRKGIGEDERKKKKKEKEKKGEGNEFNISSSSNSSSRNESFLGEGQRNWKDDGRRRRIEGGVDCDYYYGNGLIDSYGIVFRRLIELGELEKAREIYKDFKVLFLKNNDLNLRRNRSQNQNQDLDGYGDHGYGGDWDERRRGGKKNSFWNKRDGFDRSQQNFYGVNVPGWIKKYLELIERSI